MGESHKSISKEESSLQASIADIKTQMEKLDLVKYCIDNTAQDNFTMPTRLTFTVCLIRKKQSRHAERKKEDIMRMLRDDVGTDLKRMVKTDLQVRNEVGRADVLVQKNEFNDSSF